MNTQIQNNTRIFVKGIPGIAYHVMGDLALVKFDPPEGPRVNHRGHWEDPNCWISHSMFTLNELTIEDPNA